MTNIKGIPFIWDLEGDDNLYGSLYPKSSTFVANLPIYSGLYNKETFPKLPFESNNISSDKLAAEEGLNLIQQDNGYEFWVDGNNVLNGQTAEVEITAPPLPPALEKQMNGFKLTIFTHSDGIKIQNYNKRLQPQSDQLILILENNDKGNRLGSVMYVKVGSDIKNKDFPMADVFAAMSGTGVNLSKKNLQDLLNPSVVKSKLKVLAKTVNVLATVPNSLMS
jgi:hypothetical protein